MQEGRKAAKKRRMGSEEKEQAGKGGSGLKDQFPKKKMKQ